MFQMKDRIRVKENGFTGRILATVGFPQKGDVLYHVIWDHFPNKIQQYMASDVGDLWEKMANIVKALEAAEPDKNYVSQDPDKKNLPNGVNNHGWNVGIDFGYLPEEKKKECDHRWVNASLQFEKLCCYHCGIDKP